MDDQVIMASRFKAECLAILDQVDELKISVTVTKYGRPVARLVPVQAATDLPVLGSVRLVAEDDAAYYGTGERWSTDKDPG